jgi:hypothetical protein
MKGIDMKHKSSFAAAVLIIGVSIFMFTTQVGAQRGPKKGDNTMTSVAPSPMEEEVSYDVASGSGEILRRPNGRPVKIRYAKAARLLPPKGNGPLPAPLTAQELADFEKTGPKVSQNKTKRWIDMSDDERIAAIDAQEAEARERLVTVSKQTDEVGRKAKRDLEIADKDKRDKDGQ